MSIRTIMWTALPNGLAEANGKLRLSVLVSPRLVTNSGAGGTLAEFPEFLDWPQVVRELAFRVEFQGGPAFDVAPPPSYSGALDSDAWRALFHRDTAVNSFAFADKADLNVLSFPTKRILSFVRQQYQALAVASPQARPTLAQLGLGLRSRGRALGQLALDRGTLEQVDAQLRQTLERYHAMPPELGNPALDFYQVQVMHRALSKEVLDADRHRKPLPPMAPPTLDFHQGVAALGQYPLLARTLGIVVDLELPREHIPSTSSVRVTPRLAARPPAMNMTPWTACRFDAAGNRFIAASSPGSDVADGMLLLSGPDQYDVTEMDVDGAASKLQDFATTMVRMTAGGRASIDTPARYGVPSLRSAGFSASRAGRALKLVNTFQQARANNAAIQAAKPVVLHAEDVTRGYRIDVWNSESGHWHSLCLRNGTYRFTAGTLVRTIADEGFVTMATSQSADGSSTDLRLPESLFRWRGWSLCAPKPGRTIGVDSMPADAVNPAATQLQLETAFTVQKGTLPRLRFGAQYQFRARAVDLAGNSLPPDALVDDIYSLPPQPMPYLRYEPLPSPVVVALGEFGLASPGESVERWVIRSNYDTHIAAVSERHIAPPKTTVDMAETHGMLDTPAGVPDPALYGLIADRDGSFSETGMHPEPQLALPYLPDPFAAGAAFRTLPGTGAAQKIAFAMAWPDALPFRLRLDEGSGPPSFAETATERVLTVHLPKAQVVEIDMSSHFADTDALRQMAIWSWIADAAPPNLAELEQLAVDGGHWMLSPPRTITLVHAVRQPLIEPQWQAAKVVKKLGDTFVRLLDEFPVSGASTEKLDIEACWKETVDDGSDQPQPVVTDATARAFEVAIARSDLVAAVDGKHEFHDTRHRMVNYTVRATTRFREYFPPELTADIANISRVSLPVTLSIPNSARPAAPKPLYVIPTFRWTPQTEGAWNFSRREGGGLRVYLDRPWFSSGEGELLGVVLWGCPPPEHDAFLPFAVPDYLKSYVTQWGKDPLWSAAAPPSQAVPRREHFRNAVAFGDALSLDETAGRPAQTFAVAGHAVAFDTERQLWYCDIELDPGDAYFPFIRLALARYQPQSLPDAHLSRVVLAEFAQLMPDRSASITLDPLDLDRLELAISGLTYAGPGAASMRVTLQTQPAGSSGELAWVPVSVTPLVAHHASGPATLWTASLTLTAPRGSRPFRLLIEEFETFETGSGGAKQTRLVYADYLNL